MNSSYYYKEGGGITFIDPNDEENSRHSFNDYGLILKNENVTNPEPQVNFIEIPFRNGSIDLSEPFGEETISFKDRFATFELSDVNYQKDYILKFSELAQFILGKRRIIVLDKDPTYYYIGRCTGFSDPEVESNSVTSTITFEVEPFRYANCSAEHPWLWNPFCFITDMAIDSGSFVVDGTLTRIINTGEIDITPSITVDSQMSLEFEDYTYTLYPGTTKNYNIRLRGRHENILKFTGHGTVTIDYRGGRF